MKKRLGLWGMVVCLGMLGVGCKTVEKAVLPGHSEVLIYNLPYDLTYLRTLEALQTVKDWELRLTEKERGILRVYCQAFKAVDGTDEREITFLIKRINRGQTSIQIAPDDQHVPGGGALLEKVASVLNDEV